MSPATGRATRGSVSPSIQRPREQHADDIAELKSRVDFRALVSEDRTIGPDNKVRCPNEGGSDNHPSCHIYPDGRYYCFSCGAKGDVVDWLEAVHDLTKVQAIEELRRRVGGGGGSTLRKPRNRATVKRKPVTDGRKALQHSAQHSGLTLEAYAEAKHLGLAELKTWGLSTIPHHPAANGPAVKIPYLDENGEETAVRFRVSLDDKLKLIWRRGAKASLYGLWRGDVARESYAVLVEGESDSHTGWHYHLPVLGVPGANVWKPEWAKHLDAAKRVYLIQEPDEAGQTFVNKVAATPGLAERLHVVTLNNDVKDLSGLHLKDPERFMEHWRAAKDNAVPYGEAPAPEVADEAVTEAADGDIAEESKSKSTQAQKLIELAEGNTSELFHTPDETAYALVPIGNHHETMAVKSRRFRSRLYKLFYDEHHGPPNNDAMQGALKTLEAKALYDGEEIPVYVRLAEQGGKIYLDLADAEWRVVEVDSDGWRILARSPVRFKRPKGLKALPIPVEGGSVDTLRQFVHATDDMWMLIKAFLVACLCPDIPYPLLVLIAEQGSGKSTLAEFIKALLDGNLAPLRAPPRDARDLMIAATNSWLPTFDNISNIPEWLSNALCGLATGRGFSTRTLYENDEEQIFEAMRPVILTGIDELAGQGDLLDRSLITNLQRIPPSKRRPKSKLEAKFKEVAPGILGALLNAVSYGLGHPADTPNLPRMADFAAWVVACAPKLGMDGKEFLRAYSENRRGANQTALDASPVPELLRKLLANHDPWSGTATELQAALDSYASEYVRKQRRYPKNNKALGSALRRLAPNLRETGIDVDFTKESGGNRQRRISLKSNAPDVPNVPNEEEMPSQTEGQGGTSSGTSKTTEGQTSLKRPGKTSVPSGNRDNRDVRDVSIQPLSGAAHEPVDNPPKPPADTRFKSETPLFDALGQPMEEF